MIKYKPIHIYDLQRISSTFFENRYFSLSHSGIHVDLPHAVFTFHLDIGLQLNKIMRLK